MVLKWVVLLNTKPRSIRLLCCSLTWDRVLWHDCAGAAPACMAHILLCQRRLASAGLAQAVAVQVKN